MKKVFLFSFAQLMKLVGLLYEIIMQIVNVIKKKDNPNEEKVES